MKGMMDTVQVLFLPYCFGAGMLLLSMYNICPSADPVPVFCEFSVVSAATCLPPALSSSTVVYRSDDTHTKDGDALYLQGFYPSAICFGRRLCCWHISTLMTYVYLLLPFFCHSQEGFSYFSLKKACEEQGFGF